MKLRNGAAGRAEVNHHVMSVYFEPLRVYFQATSYRWLGDSTDVVQGFFADRLHRDAFFSDWQQRGSRLRRWLMNALCLYARELARSRNRKREQVNTYRTQMRDQVASSLRPEEALDKAFAVSIIRQAIAQTRGYCMAHGLEVNWNIFVENWRRNRPFKEIATDFGCDENQARVKARTVRSRFRLIIRNLVSRDGATEVAIDDEIRYLLEITGK